FIDAVASDLGALSGRQAGAHLADVTVEAANIAGAIIASDGRFTEAELDGYLDAVGPLLDPPLVTSATALRDAGVLERATDWLAQPSVLFDLLARADARDGGTRAQRYYELALRLAHVTAALDLVPSPAELDAIDRLRTSMLHHLDAVGVTRPGQPAPIKPATQGPAAAPAPSPT
ncbi:unnamed protein product, partial [Phaeothamnion confervicola]